MSERPTINPGDFISVGLTECVVCRVRDVGHSLGDCEVVCNRKKPGNRDVAWREGAWAFINPNDFGGYAERNEQLWPFIRILRREA